MSNVFESTKNRILGYAANVGKARLRRELLGRSDRSLADIGFSRELLDLGVSAWPWRLNAEKKLPLSEIEPALSDVQPVATEITDASHAPRDAVVQPAAGPVDATDQRRPATAKILIEA